MTNRPQSAQLSNLFKGPSRVWSFGAGVLQPIFNAGRIRGQVAQPEALQRQALYTYEKSIISAFQDVENALIDRTKFGQVREEQAKNVEALRRFRDLADLRYREGATIYLEVANAEQNPGIIEENLVVKGGWVDEGPTLKRFRPRAYGRATQIRKRTSHITLVVENIGEELGGGA